MVRKLISIIVPVYNEEDNVDIFYDTLSKIISNISKYNFEIIFTDNHSTDATFSMLEKISCLDSRVRVLRFSRNYGYQRSILTGYLNAKGDAAIQLDCDLQDPPELIVEFLDRWENGCEVVYGIRKQRAEGIVITALRKFFYRLIDRFSEVDLPHDAGDFRLVDRKIIDALALMDHKQPYLRGMIAAIGFKQLGIPYGRASRLRGESKFSFGQLCRLAIDGITAYSIFPLRFATFAGLIISLISILAIAFYIISKIYFGQSWPAGFTTVTILILFSCSLSSLFLGIIGEYLGRIYLQVRDEPITVIEKELGPKIQN